MGIPILERRHLYIETAPWWIAADEGMRSILIVMDALDETFVISLYRWLETRLWLLVHWQCSYHKSGAKPSLQWWNVYSNFVHLKSNICLSDSVCQTELAEIYIRITQHEYNIDTGANIAFWRSYVYKWSWYRGIWSNVMTGYYLWKTGNLWVDFTNES